MDLEKLLAVLKEVNQTLGLLAQLGLKVNGVLELSDVLALLPKRG